MGIYHFGRVKIINRANGKGAVASSAYISGEKIHNDYDNITHDYTRKTGVVYKEIMLCGDAPKEWKNRTTLWNEVEKIEKAKDSQLARSFDVGLQKEFSFEENRNLVREYVKNNFIDKGMCADFCIHDKNDGNPHAHIMLTMRKVNKNGKFSSKAEKEYLCRNTQGQEKYFNAKDFKDNDDFEKIYKCRYKNDYKNLTNSQLKSEEFKNYKKASKYPLDRKIDKCSDWNDKNNVELWRENWANINNKLFKEKGINIKLDHRSYEKQGIEKLPTIHEGYGARLRLKRGKESDRVDINKQIKEINNQIKEYDIDIHKLKNEIKGLNDGIEKINKFNIDNIRENIEILNNRVPDDVIKKFKINLDDLIRYMDKMGIKNKKDIEKVRTQLSVVKSKHEEILDSANNYLDKMKRVYDRIICKEKEINYLKREVSELGIFKIKRKIQLNEDIEHLEGEINELKASEYFHKDKTCDSKVKELTVAREKSRKILKLCDKGYSSLYDIKLLDDNMENLIKYKDKDINVKTRARIHSNDLEI